MTTVYAMWKINQYKEMSDGFITIITAAISAVVSAFVSYTVLKRSDKSTEKRDLDNQLSEILKLAIQNPYFELKSFTDKWDSKIKETDDKYAAYDIYATIVYNFLERYSRFYKHNLKDIEDNLKISEWIKIHKKYWQEPYIAGENNSSYDKRFVSLVEGILK